MHLPQILHVLENSAAPPLRAGTFLESSFEVLSEKSAVASVCCGNDVAHHPLLVWKDTCHSSVYSIICIYWAQTLCLLLS